MASRGTRDDVCQVIGNRFYLLTNPIFYECRRLWRKHLCQCRLRAGEITETIADKFAHVRFKVFIIDELMESTLRESQNLPECFVADSFVQSSFEQLINLPVDKLLDRIGGLLALQHGRDLLR